MKTNKHTFSIRPETKGLSNRAVAAILSLNTPHFTFAFTGRFTRPGYLYTGRLNIG